MTSKTSNYDNNPNSIFGASKRVVATYNKKVNPSSVSTSSFSSFPQGDKTITPFQQGQKSKPKSEVVSNLNEFTSLIKTITLGLNNVDTYLTTQAGDDNQGSGMYRYRGGMPKRKQTAEEKEEARQEAFKFIVEKYRNEPKGTKISKEDLKLIKKYSLTDGINLANKKEVSLVLPLVYQKKEREDSIFLKASSNKASVAYAEDEDDEADDEARFDDGEEALNAYAEEAPRFTEKPNYPDIWGGDPEADPAQAREQDTAFRRWRAPPDASQLSGSEDEGSGNEDSPMGQYDPFLPLKTYDSDGDSSSDSGDIDPDTELEDILASSKKKVITENYLITLITAIINQLNKAQDIWEENISVNLSYIPKIKMDSFVNSKTIKDFEDIIARLEDNATTIIVKKFYNFLDKVFSKLIETLDGLFNVINLDIKRYSGGIGISRETNKIAPNPINEYPLLIGSGFVPFKTGYNPFVNASMSKYLL